MVNLIIFNVAWSSSFVLMRPRQELDPSYGQSCEGHPCCSATRFAQCEHVMDKLMQRGEQMESGLPAAAAEAALYLGPTDGG